MFGFLVFSLLNVAFKSTVPKKLRQRKHMSTATQQCFRRALKYPFESLDSAKVGGQRRRRGKRLYQHVAPPRLEPVNSSRGWSRHPVQHKGASTLNQCRGCDSTFLTIKTPVISLSCWHVRPLDKLIRTRHTALSLGMCVFCKSITLVRFLFTVLGIPLSARSAKW